MIWQSPGLPGWRKVNFITVTRRPHHPNITAGLYCLATSPGFSLVLFARSEVGSFTCIGYFSPIHGTDSVKSPSLSSFQVHRYATKLKQVDGMIFKRYSLRKLLLFKRNTSVWKFLIVILLSSTNCYIPIVYWSIYLSIYLSICLSIDLYINLSLCISF